MIIIITDILSLYIKKNYTSLLNVAMFYHNTKSFTVHKNNEIFRNTRDIVEITSLPHRCSRTPTEYGQARQDRSRDRLFVSAKDKYIPRDSTSGYTYLKIVGSAFHWQRFVPRKFRGIARAARIRSCHRRHDTHVLENRTMPRLDRPSL